MAITLISEAVEAGAMKIKACGVLKVSIRTVQRSWTAAAGCTNRPGRPIQNAGAARCANGHRSARHG
ncbi:hypothetical protein [Desulfolithobacter sp.]